MKILYIINLKEDICERTWQFGKWQKQLTFNNSIKVPAEMDVRLCLVIIIKNENENFCNNSNFSLVLLAYRYGTDLAVHKRYLWHTTLMW